MKILIVDDDLEFGERLKNLINEKFSDKKNDIIVKEKLINADIKKKYDYYFIDIMLKGENGINYGKMIIDKYYFAKIIYMSSEDSLVYDTFASKVYFFIRKCKLGYDLEKLWIKIDQDAIKNSDHIEIISERKRQMILKKDIIYIESNRNKCQIYMENNKYEAYKTLKSFSHELDSDQYFRINSYTIINLEYTKAVNGKKVTLINNKTFALKKNYKEFIEAYHNNYMKRLKE